MPVHTSQGTATLIAGQYIAVTDPAMSRILEATGAQSDHELADAIEADARERLHRGLSNSLSRYLDAIPNLTGLRIALDAAIEFAIRAAVHAGATEADAVRTLAAAHPSLAEAIETAFALSEGLASTTTLARSAGRPTPLKVPCEYGPRFPDGGRRFDVRQRLGVGSQGEVYLAADRQLSESDRPAWVAIKRMRPMMNVDAASQAAAEARKARRISHPNVVRVFDRATDDAGMDYIVYEHIDDGDLAQWFAKRAEPLPPRQAAQLVAQICRGMQAAHLAGVVHCDLKPSNVLLTRDAVPKVADFGVAAAVRSDAGRIPDATPVGNLAFTAPEQFRGDDGAQAIPADIYALGGLLYFLLTGKAPNGETPAQVSARHNRPDSLAPSPQALRPDVEPDLDAICRRALAPLPADRYASAHALAQDLEAWLSSTPIDWLNPSRKRRVALLLKRQPSLVAASILLILALIAGASATVYFAMRGREQVLKERYAAAVELQREQERMIIDVKRTIASTLNVVEYRSRDGIELEWFPPLTILESVSGPLLFSTVNTGEVVDLWSGRAARVRTMLEQAEKAGHGFGLEELLWRDALAFWLLRAGDFRGAEKTLRETSPHWDRIIADDPRFRLTREGMLACTVVQEHAARLGDQSATPIVDLTKLAEAASTLERAIAAINGDMHHRAMRIVFLTNLKRAYGKDLLNRTRDAAEIQLRLLNVEGLAPESTVLPKATPVPTR